MSLPVHTCRRARGVQALNVTGPSFPFPLADAFGTKSVPRAPRGRVAEATAVAADTPDRPHGPSTGIWR